MQYEKGFQVLVRAIAELRQRIPEVRAVIAGRGSYLPELQTQIDVEGVTDIVDLAGFVPDDDLRAILSSTHEGLFSSDELGLYFGDFRLGASPFDLLRDEMDARTFVRFLYDTSRRQPRVYRDVFRVLGAMGGQTPNRLAVPGRNSA